MAEIAEQPDGEPPGVTVEWIAAGGCLYEYKTGVRERSRLRGMLMDAASVLASSAESHVVLVLVEPDLSSETIEALCSGALEIFQKKLAKRLTVVEARRETDGKWKLAAHLKKLAPENEKVIMDGLTRELAEGQAQSRSRPGNSGHEILRVLVARWLLDRAPITLKKLGEEVGYTYKPVRLALDGLRAHLSEHGQSGVGLKSFPRDAWSRLFLDASTVRETIPFWPRGEMPRTPDSMLKRFHQIPEAETPHVGIGGVAGSRFYSPDLDLIGLPRVDFTVHCPEGDPDLRFLRRIDPALAPVEDPMGACSVMVHLLRRPKTYFTGRFADPAECLLDLQEMRLEAQARQLLRSFSSAKGEDF